MLFLQILFWIAAFIIFWAMIGYRLSLKVLQKIYSDRQLKKDYEYKPIVSVMIVAHNEEKVILDKLENVIDNDYPKDKIEYLVASDWCTDSTNEIVEEFISSHPSLNIILNKSKEHKGKTNAQNETQKLASGEILIMTDANAMFEHNAISELVAAFSADDIAYVCGRLKYVNSDSNITASSESAYWESDLEQRKIESNIKTITGGNGAIYACRNSYYVDFDPIRGHDGTMPFYYGKQGKRCLYNPDAIACEKAGENIEDEYKRKVRMARGGNVSLKRGFEVINVFKYGWFSYFYFGHRTCRGLLWMSHVIVFVLSIVLAFFSNFFKVVFAVQAIFYLLAIIDLIVKPNNKILNMMGYYTMTLLAKAKGFFKFISGKSKSTWDSVESTR